MAFSISGLSPEPFRPLFGLPDEALVEQGGPSDHRDARCVHARPDRIKGRTAGEAAFSLIERMLGASDVAYLHAHYARWSCYAARVDRA